MFAAIGTDIAQSQIFNEMDLYQLILIIFASFLAVMAIFDPKIYERAPQWISSGVTSLKTMIYNIGGDVGTDDDSLDKAMKRAGYSYNQVQDIFYSNMDAWQRWVGYCHLYDEAAAPLGMIIDCEPIYFKYKGKRWMIEFWKGQYDLATGCEIGVYTTEEPDIYIPGLFRGTFYNCASDEDRLIMSFALRKNGETLLIRRSRHWWLTGFKVGEFSQPSELTMDLSITLKDQIMRNAFIRGLRKAGYSSDEIEVEENTVSLTFNKPRTPQPITRNEETDSIIQQKNQLMCAKYQEITGPYDNFPDKMNAILEQAPELYDDIIKMGKTKQLFEKFEKLKKYLE